MTTDTRTPTSITEIQPTDISDLQSRALVAHNAEKEVKRAIVSRFSQGNSRFTRRPMYGTEYATGTKRASLRTGPNLRLPSNGSYSYSDNKGQCQTRIDSRSRPDGPFRIHRGFPSKKRETPLLPGFVMDKG